MIFNIEDFTHLGGNEWEHIPTGGLHILAEGGTIEDHVAELNAPPAPPSKEQLLAHLAAHRWAVETVGIQLNGMTVATDDRSKTMIMGARVAAMANPDHVVNWKMPDGSWAPLDAATITAVSDAVLDHVNRCFARESDVAELITAGDITGYEGVVAAFDV